MKPVLQYINRWTSRDNRWLALPCAAAALFVLLVMVKSCQGIVYNVSDECRIYKLGYPIEEARALGINADGPVPPDTVFSKARGGWYDIVVCMYHDQGHIPLKVVGFVYNQEAGKWDAVEGINLTLGLPIVRVSVDHGTAFDQAGTGMANELSLMNAIDYAARLSRSRKARKAE